MAAITTTSNDCELRPQDHPCEACFNVMRLWHWTALMWMSCAAFSFAQMAEQPVVDLKKGLVIHPEAEINLRIDKDGLPGGSNLTQPIELTDYSLSFCLSFEEFPKNGGDHWLSFAAVRVGDVVFILALTPHGHLVLTGGSDLCEASRQPLKIGKNAIAITVKRDPRQSLSSLWVDGVEQMSFQVSPGKGELTHFVMGAMELHSGIVSNIRLYNRALGRQEIIALAQVGLPLLSHSAEPFAVLGGTEIVMLVEGGWFESRLLDRTALEIQPVTDPFASDTPEPVRLRLLAWEADTVFKQDRPLNFGNLAQQLQRVDAHSLIVNYGRSECLERGLAGLADFRKALEATVAPFNRGTLIGPAPFEKMSAPHPDLSTKNQDLQAYNEAIRDVAAKHKMLFCDLIKGWPADASGFTSDGLQLTPLGLRIMGSIVAQCIHDQLPGKAMVADNAHAERLRQVAVQKNALWHRYWRPSNWAFLYGDRTTQPSSRDHLNPNIRWFPQELEQYRALIDAKEHELWKLSQELGRKLP